jgi:hypothetical protein
MRAAGKAVARVRRDPTSGLPAKTPVATMLDPDELEALDAWIRPTAGAQAFATGSDPAAC